MHALNVANNPDTPDGPNDPNSSNITKCVLKSFLCSTNLREDTYLG